MVVMAIILLVAGGFALNGCTGSGPSNSSVPVIVSPADHIAQVSSNIRMGTSMAVSIGLVAIPDQKESNAIATETNRVLKENVFPLLNGDEQGLVNGFNSLLSLDAFNSPTLTKVKPILQVAIGILKTNLDPNLLKDNTVAKLPDDVKSYLNAFFNGVNDGVSQYLGTPPATNKEIASKSITYKELIKLKPTNYDELRRSLNK